MYLNNSPASKKKLSVLRRSIGAIGTTRILEDDETTLTAADQANVGPSLVQTFER